MFTNYRVICSRRWLRLNNKRKKSFSTALAEAELFYVSKKEAYSSLVKRAVLNAARGLCPQRFKSSSFRLVIKGLSWGREK